MGGLQSKTILENTAYTLTFYVSSESLTQIKLLITHSFSNMFSVEPFVHGRAVIIPWSCSSEETLKWTMRPSLCILSLWFLA